MLMMTIVFSCIIILSNGISVHPFVSPAHDPDDLIVTVDNSTWEMMVHYHHSSTDFAVAVDVEFNDEDNSGYRMKSEK